MTGVTGSPAAPGRRTRDSAVTRRALLSAAQHLFGQKGYERTTTREIGTAAGVDPALIARYFGSKADLYLAAVAADRLDGSDGSDAPFADLAEVAEVVLRRSAKHGPGPTLQALVRHDASPEIRDAATARLVRRMVEPLTAQYAAAGADRPGLRAQLAVAAILGTALGHSLGWFDELASADSDRLAALLVEALRPPVQGAS